MLRVFLSAITIFHLNFSLLSPQIVQVQQGSSATKKAPVRNTTSAKDNGPQIEGKDTNNGSSRREIEKKAMNSSKYVSLDQKRALALLESLPDKVKDIENEEFKIRVQIQIADAMWDYDEPRARSQLMDAFQSIGSMKSQKNQDMHAHNTKGAMFESPRFRLQQEALRVIAKRDYALAETLRKSINVAADDKVMNETTRGDSEEQVMHSMLLAASLAKTDPSRASQIVRDNFSVWGFENLTPLLIGIRHENSALADNLFSEALSVARNQPTTVFNNIGLLAPYVFPTEEEMLFGRDPMANPMRRAMIERFFNFVSEVISQRANAEQIDSITDRQATAATAQKEYLTLRQLISVFDKLTLDNTSTIRNRIEQLARDIPAPQLNAAQRNTRQTGVQEILKRAETLSNTFQKNAFYVRAAMEASRMGDMNQALSIAGMLSNEKDRLGLRSMILHQAAIKALDKKDVDAAYDFAKDIEVIQDRVDVYKRLAHILFGSKNNSRAENILRDIEQWVENADTGVEKVAALLDIAVIVAKHDSTRLLDLMKSVCIAINDADVVKPPTQNLIGERVVRKRPVTMESLDIKSGFSLLARLDFDQASQLARSIEKNEVSIMAQIAVCQEILTNSLTSQPNSNKSASTSPQVEQQRKDNKKR